MWILFAIMAAMLWGLNYTLTERLLYHISPTTLLAFEMLVGSIIFFTISFFTTFKADVTTLLNESNLLSLAAIEIVTVLVANVLIAYSIQGKDATISGLIELIYPLFIVFFTWFFFKENHVNVPVLLGGGLVLFGAAIISFA